MRRASKTTVWVLLLALAAGANESEEAPRPTLPMPSVPKFTAKTLDAAGRLPVQDQGRVKPLSTYAAFTLLRIHHKRTFRDSQDAKWKPTAWFLRTTLYPLAAIDDEIFTIEESKTLDAIGLGDIKKKRRDRYSLRELRPGLRRLRELYSDYVQIDEKLKTPVQRQLVLLQHKVFTFEGLLYLFTFAEVGVPLRNSELSDQFEGRESVPMSEALRKLMALRAKGENPAWAQALGQMAMSVANESRALRMIPPLGADDGHKAEWMSVTDLVHAVQGGEGVPEADIEMLEKLEAVYHARHDADELEAAMGDLSTDARARAESIGAYDKISLEVFYYKMDFFFRAKWLFVLAFVLLAISWLIPNKGLGKGRFRIDAYRGVWALSLIGLGLLIAGITVRCVLRGRPPVSTLYETILFIAAVTVLSTLIIEWINKRRIVILAAPVLGAALLWMAELKETADAEDTMPQLVAVLDTNFWLTIHVTCITLGYAAGLLAAAIAHIYVVGKAFGLKKNDKEFYRAVGRMVYGTICFSLLFSVVGTILGGVWANDSWGRFWGWDPKENGALLIVLSQLAIIHARLGGYIKAFGISMAAIAGGMVIAFSWWGVNLLGIGLHSYGFAAGLDSALNTFYIAETLLIVFAGSIWAYERYVGRSSAA